MGKKPKMTFSPLKGSVMVFAIVGFLVTVYIVYPLSLNFSIALGIVFVAMFIASLISMTVAPIKEERE